MEKMTKKEVMKYKRISVMIGTPDSAKLGHFYYGVTYGLQENGTWNINGNRWEWTTTEKVVRKINRLIKEWDDSVKIYTLPRDTE